MLNVPAAQADETAAGDAPSPLGLAAGSPQGPSGSGLPPMGEAAPPMAQAVPPMAEAVPPMGQAVPPMAEAAVPMAEPAPRMGGGLALPATRAPTDGSAVQSQLVKVNQMVESGRYLEATQALNSISAEASSNPGYYYLLGLAYSGLGNYPHALDNFNRAVAAGVRTPKAFYVKGQAELNLGQYPAAVESLDAAIELAGTDVPDYIADLARAYDGARMPRDAAATWGALQRINPSHPAILERQRKKEEGASRRHNERTQRAMLQMQREKRSSDTACWVCLILRCLLECM